jgi:hypothetical protein
VHFQKLSYLFDGSPNRVQFALNGAWEQAIKFDLETTNEDLIDSATAALLENFSGDVAVEVFFGPKCNSMLGFRYSSTLNVTPKNFLIGLTHLALQANDFDSYFDGLQNLGEAWKFRAFTSEPQLAELGILNAWSSYKTLNLWCKPAEKILCLNPGFGRVPHLLRNPVNHVLLEFAFDSIAPHWAGFVVSDQVEIQALKIYELDQLVVQTICTGFGFTLESDPEVEQKWLKVIE